MKVICKCNKDCSYSYNNNGSCEHSILHDCREQMWIKDEEHDCNCSLKFVKFLHKEKLEKLEYGSNL